MKTELTSIPEIFEILEGGISAVDLWFPHISKIIVLNWGTEYINEYTDSLFFTTRVGRKGFPPVVMAELAQITALHRKVFPKLAPPKHLWGS